MSEQQALVKVEPQDIVVSEANQSTQTLLSAIATAVASPDVNVESMKEMVGLYERLEASRHKQAFLAALARLQAKLPQVQKDGRIVVNDTIRSRYARIEDIDVVIRPLLQEEGFALSFDSKSQDAKNYLLTCKLSHKDGHSESKEILLPLDKGSRSDVQSVGSTVSYGRRLLIKMHLNLIERGEDDDGMGGAKPITEEQVAEINKVFSETRFDPQGQARRFGKQKFLAHMGVEKIEAIASRNFRKAMNAIDTWRSNTREKA